jgi:hypothetical protein
MPDLNQERKERREALTSEYAAVVGNFRELTEIRFKLLSLLPLASLAAAALKPDPSSPGSLPFALFGLAVTISVAAYNKRNDQLYDQLVDRAAVIERELGTPDGAYANRLVHWLSFRVPRWPRWACSVVWEGPPTWTVDHRFSVAVIYLITAAFWVYLALEAAAAAISGIPPIPSALDGLKPILGPQTVGTVLSVLSWLLAAFAFFLTLVVACWLRKREKARRKEMKDAVKQGVESIMKAEEDYLSAELGLGEPAPASALAADAVVSGAFLNKINLSALIEQCIRAKSGRSDDRNDAKLKLERRIAFYASLSASEMRLYVRPQSGKRRAAQMMALLTDLSPTWIYDVTSGRKDS